MFVMYYSLVSLLLLCTVLPYVKSSAINGTARFANEENCGVSSISRSNTQGRIVNGIASTQGQWPWQAAIVLDRSGSQSVICGGSLINERWVITAAHCFENELLSDLSVFLGVNNRIDPLESNRQIHQLRNKTCHPGYTDGVFIDDICLLHLSSDATYTTYIRPICLPDQGSAETVGDRCIISGWGDTENTGNSNILQYAEVEIINHTTCSSWYQEVGVSVPEDHICAGFEQGGTDSCQGDSGGPLACQETVSTTSAYVLRGVTSFGLGCADARRPGVYTKVSEYITWIDEVIASSAKPFHQVRFSMALPISMLFVMISFSL